jgi:hypothetical protein
LLDVGQVSCRQVVETADLLTRPIVGNVDQHDVR